MNKEFCPPIKLDTTAIDEIVEVANFGYGIDEEIMDELQFQEKNQEYDL